MAGALRAGYDPVHDAISRLAELGAPDRWIVTSGMVAFGIGCLVVAPAWPLAPRVSLLVAGLSSFGVAAFPCTEGCPGEGSITDLMHSLLAGGHYIALLATPILAARSPWNLAASAVAGLALGLHVWGPGPNGLMQRIGLTVLDLWLVWTVTQGELASGRTLEGRGRRGL